MSIRFFSKSSIRTGEKYSNAWDKTLSRDYELISTTLISSNTASVTFSNLGDYSSTYKHLQLRIVVSPLSSSDARLLARFNNISSSSYSRHGIFGNGSSVTTYGEADKDHLRFATGISFGGDNIFTPVIVDILDPFSTSKNTTIRSFRGTAFTDEPRVALESGALLSTDSITSIQLAPGNLTYSSGSFKTGSRFSLYGIR